MPFFCAPQPVRLRSGPYLSNCRSPHALAWSRARRILASVSVAAFAGSSLGACSGEVTEPDIDCTFALGVPFIELAPPTPGFETYTIAVGDSIQVVASLRQVTEAVPTFNVQQGWTCAIIASSPLTGSVALTTNDTNIVRIDPGGWIRALNNGSATITATSTAPVVSTTFGVIAN